jgi:hypothetical protein
VVMSPAGSDPRTTALARPAAIVNYRPVLSSERTLHKDYNSKCSVGKKNDGHESQGVWRQDELIGGKVTLTLSLTLTLLNNCCGSISGT